MFAVIRDGRLWLYDEIPDHEMEWCDLCGGSLLEHYPIDAEVMTAVNVSTLTEEETAVARETGLFEAFADLAEVDGGRAVPCGSRVLRAFRHRRR